MPMKFSFNNFNYLEILQISIAVRFEPEMTFSGVFQQNRSCVDGSLLARVILRSMQAGRVQSCVRPVDAAYMAAGPNAIRWIGSQSEARA
jgi:hypothetical protein